MMRSMIANSFAGNILAQISSLRAATVGYLIGVIAIAMTSPTLALDFVFDYEYDTSGFFDPPDRREALELAGRLINRYTDDLLAIEPSGDNSWTAFLTRPDSGNFLVLNSETIPEDAMVFYPGGRSLPCCLAQSEAMQLAPSGDAAWSELVMHRGETGADATPATDFGASGGMLSFSEEVNWHFGTETSGLNVSEFDFVTVAMHEILHVMGFASNSASSFNDNINGSMQFIGAEAVAVGSPTNPDLQLDEIEAHWISGTKSLWNGSTQEALLAPGIFPGRRAMPTLLDRAVMRDVGWEEAIAGDATRDRVFDSQDLVRAFQSGLYETGNWAGWADGDWTDDGRFASNDLIAALQTGTFETINAVDAIRLSEGPATDEPFVIATYDQPTGQLAIETENGFLTTLQIESAAKMLLGSGDLDGIFDVDRDDKLFLLDVAGFNDRHFDGLLPSGLTEAELLADLSFDGSWAQGGAVTSVALRVVPEPATAGMLAMALVGVLAISRRSQSVVTGRIQS